MNTLQSVYNRILNDFNSGQITFSELEGILDKTRHFQQRAAACQQRRPDKWTTVTDNKTHRFILPVATNSCDLKQLLNLQKQERAHDQLVDLKTMGVPGVQPFYATIATSPQSIPECFMWLSDATHKEGLYMSPVKNVYVRVRLAELCYLKDPKPHYPVIKSIKCRYGTLENCRQHTFPERTCSFVHKGEEFTRIGSASRCTTVPRFGNKEYIANDIHSLTLSDINTLLMHSVADLFLVTLWYRANYTSKVFFFEDIDKFI